MNAKADFDALVERAMATRGRGQMRPVIEKELLHYDMLFALDQARLLDRLTFQGGTALRLCHGAPRFSEDLDFAGGTDFAADNLKEMGHCLEQAIGRRYGLEVHAKAPKTVGMDTPERGVDVHRWQLTVTTAPARPDIPRQRIRIEIASVPAYTHEPLSLRHNYDFLPDGYADTLIQTETLEEIMADKLLSLVNTQHHVRYRDIWDLRWLNGQGIEPNGELVGKKIADYRVERYEEKLTAFRDRLESIITSPSFRDTMTRFIPADVQERTFGRAGFEQFLIQATDQLLASTAKQLSHSPDIENHRI